MADNLNLYYYRRNLSVTEDFKYPFAFFRFKKVSKILNKTFYNIEELLKKFKLGYLSNKELNFNRINDDSHLWLLKKINNGNFIIQNKDSCFIKINKLKVFCDNITIYEATQFKIIRMFSEVDENKGRNYYELLNQEPIDIIIKYIDLKDPGLKREGIHQIEKDYDNEELRYSIRSILNNIPWVRKIFILMPNEKVRYFKDYNLTKEKIIYVKDKDLLGYDSSNSNAFQFNYWKMKKFGISDNIIVMDDDCFIGEKLEKKDFFYIKKGKIVPSIVTSEFIKIEQKSIKENCELYHKKTILENEEQNNAEFLYSKYLTLEFILNIFNLTNIVYIPNFTHNAIPVNLNDLKEIYDIVYASKYKNASLDCLYRIEGYLQFQIFVLSYTFLKYERKIHNIPNKYIRLNNSLSQDYKISLFCINKGSGNYSYLNFYKAKLIMEYLFPIPSPYEIVDNSFMSLSFNVAYSMDKIIRTNEKQIELMRINEKNIYFVIVILNIIIILRIIRILKY